MAPPITAARRRLRMCPIPPIPGRLRLGRRQCRACPDPTRPDAASATPDGALSWASRRAPWLLFGVSFLVYAATAARGLVSLDVRTAYIASWRIASSGVPWIEGLVAPRHRHPPVPGGVGARGRQRSHRHRPVPRSRGLGAARLLALRLGRSHQQPRCADRRAAHRGRRHADVPRVAGPPAAAPCPALRRRLRLRHAGVEHRGQRAVAPHADRPGHRRDGLGGRAGPVVARRALRWRRGLGTAARSRRRGRPRPARRPVAPPTGHRGQGGRRQRGQPRADEPVDALDVRRLEPDVVVRHLGLHRLRAGQPLSAS